MSKPLLYLSPNSSPDEKVARLNPEVFVQRLNDLTEAVQSLNKLAKLMQRQRRKR